jgi:hypothetical protein
MQLFIVTWQLDYFKMLYHLQKLSYDGFMNDEPRCCLLHHSQSTIHTSSVISDVTMNISSDITNMVDATENFSCKKLNKNFAALCQLKI